LFLDELGNLPLPMQGKLLRALQEREVERIGTSRPVPIDVRIVSATNVPLEERVKRGEFRLDLYHRLAEFPITIPPLRERVEDLLYLAVRFLREATDEFGKALAGFSADAIEELVAWPWEGNVRELRNAIRRSALTSSGRIERVFGPGERGPAASSRVTRRRAESATILEVRAVIQDALIREGFVPIKEILGRLGRELEREILEVVLERSGGNKSLASRILGLDYKTVHTKTRRYQIEGRGTR
jgi:two-component system nitrogen regulation response regulator GlnG